MDIQRLRNLTTGILHTEISHFYEDIEFLTNMEGVMTHMIPNVIKAMHPWLLGKVNDARYWDGKYDPDHEGEYEIEPMNANEQKLVLKRYSELPNALTGI